VLLLVGGGVLIASLLRDSSVPQHREMTTVMRVVIPPPPPPPPPPPEPPKMVEQQPKMLEQTPVPTPQQPKPAPRAPAARPVPQPPGNPLTAEAGPGANPYGLAVGNGGGDVIGGGGGGGGGSRFGYYAGLIQSQLQAALRQDEKTRSSRYRLVVELWLSPTGRVLRTQVVTSTGSPAMDGTIAHVIDSVSIGEAPPQDMPQPVHIRIGAES
jgi:outer membrane biosynthesis protein TonB